MILLRIPFLLACALVVIAASVPSSPATTLRPEDLRVASVGYALGIGGKAHCADAYPLTGLLLHHLPEYDEQGRALEIARHSLDRGPGVLATVADSPAAQAGLKAGDVLLSINGATFPDPRLMPTDRRSRSWRAAMEASEARLEAALRQGPADLTILRGRAVLSVRLEARRGCPARVRLARSDQANAFATGSYVVVTTRILSALRGDDELAIIIGHELAHNILGHERLLDKQADEGERPPGSRASRVRAAEEAADRLGLKLAAAAGYDVRAAIPMWQHLHAKFGGGLHIIRTHPSLKQRERVIREMIAQLEGGSQAGAGPR